MKSCVVILSWWFAGVAVPPQDNLITIQLSIIAGQQKRIDAFEADIKYLKTLALRQPNLASECDKLIVQAEGALAKVRKRQSEYLCLVFKAYFRVPGK